MHKRSFAISLLMAGSFVLSGITSARSESEHISNFLLNEAKANTENPDFRAEAINEYEKFLSSTVERKQLKRSNTVVKGDTVLVPKVQALLLRACNKDLTINANLKASNNLEDINATMDTKGKLRVKSESLNLPKHELLALLAHELVHAFRKDPNFINAVTEANHKQLTKMNSVMNDSEKRWLVTLQYLATKKVERKQEVLADLTAAALMELSGYNYDSVEKLLTSLVKLNIEEDDFLQHLTGKNTKSHPEVQERITILRQAKPGILKLVNQLKSSNSCLDLSNPNISVDQINI